MRPRAALFILLVLSGCAAPKPPGRADQLLPETLLLSDPEDPGVEPLYDLRAASARELNGSLVLTVTLQNLSGRVPEFVARITLASAGGSSEFFVRNEADLSRPPPHLRWSWGVVEQGDLHVRGEMCSRSSTSQPPWTIEAELLDNVTGLLEGGRIERVAVQTMDFQNHTMDAAAADVSVPLRGGTNPHAECPLFAERRPGA